MSVSARTHKTIQNLLQPRMLELDLELVAFLRDNLPVAAAAPDELALTKHEILRARRAKAYIFEKTRKNV